MFAGALDAYNACQTAVAARAASHGSPRTLSDSGSMPQDTVREACWRQHGLDGGDAKQAQQAQLAALRVQAAMLLPASAEHSKTLPFTKGEQRTCDMPFASMCASLWSVCMPMSAPYVGRAYFNGVHHMAACVHPTFPSLIHMLVIVRWE